jgi:hypothetical protein
VTINRESELALEADAEAVATFLREHGGRLDGGEDSSGIYWLTLVPASDPDETYFARLAWSEYPSAPPSVKFAKSIGGALDDPRAWPVVPGFRAQSFDICMPFTAEGFALHPEWAGTSEAWRSTGNPFLYVTSTLQRFLDIQYSGRFEP